MTPLFNLSQEIPEIPQAPQNQMDPNTILGPDFSPTDGILLQADPKSIRLGQAVLKANKNRLKKDPLFGPVLEREFTEKIDFAIKAIIEHENKRRKGVS